MPHNDFSLFRVHCARLSLLHHRLLLFSVYHRSWNGSSLGREKFTFFHPFFNRNKLLQSRLIWSHAKVPATRAALCSRKSVWSELAWRIDSVWGELRSIWGLTVATPFYERQSCVSLTTTTTSTKCQFRASMLMKLTWLYALSMRAAFDYVN